jgi:hypothetical protein
MERIRDPKFWKTPRQKQFQDVHARDLPADGAGVSDAMAAIRT